MKKLTALSLIMAIFLSAVSCGKKAGSSDEENSVPDPVITQTAYKEERISVPEGMELPTSMHVYNDGSIMALYRDTENKQHAAKLSPELELSGTYDVELPEDTDIVFMDFNSDGTVSALLMQCSDFERLAEGNWADADITFLTADYDTDMKLVSSSEISGMDTYYTHGSTFFQSFSKTEDGYVICTSNNILKTDSTGSITAHSEAGFNNYYIAASDGRIAYFDNHSGYGFADPDTLKPPSSLTPFEKDAPIQRPPLTGDDEYLCYIIMKDGYYGLTKNGSLQKIIDFTASLIDSGNVLCAARIDSGRYIMSSADPSGQGFSLMTVRPDDYVEKRRDVLVGIHNVVNESDYETANAFARYNDDYKVVYRQYDWGSDDLKTDILSDDAPDMFIGREDDVYRYSNMGAFMGLKELHDMYGGLSSDDLLPNVAKSYTLKDDIYGLPLSISLFNVFIADRELISRDDACWDFDRFAEVYSSMPEDMYLTTQYSWMNTPAEVFSQMYMYSDFIDFESASCSFDSEEFIRRLEFCKNARLLPPLGQDFYNSATEDEKRMSMEENTFMLKKRQAMLSNTFISNVNDLVMAIALNHYNIDEVTVLNAPGKREKGRLCSNSPFYSVVRSGKCTEGAWDFLNFIFDSDRMNSKVYNSEIPVTKVSYDYWMKKWRESFEQQKGMKTSTNGYVVEFTADISDEDFAYISELFTTAETTITGMDDELSSIIFSETDRYFNDEVSAEECAEMLQDRISLLLSERS